MSFQSSRKALVDTLEQFAAQVDEFDVTKAGPVGPSQFRERLHPSLVEAGTCLDDLAFYIKATGGPSLKSLTTEAQTALHRIEEGIHRLTTQLSHYGYRAEDQAAADETADQFHSAVQSSPGSSRWETAVEGEGEEEGGGGGGVSRRPRAGPEGDQDVDAGMSDDDNGDEAGRSPTEDEDLSLQTLGLSKAALRALGVRGAAPSPPPPTPATAAGAAAAGFGRDEVTPRGGQGGGGGYGGRDVTPDLTIQLSTTAMAAILGTAARPAAPPRPSPGGMDVDYESEHDGPDPHPSTSPGLDHMGDVTPPPTARFAADPAHTHTQQTLRAPPALSPRLDQLLSQIPASALKAPNSARNTAMRPAFRSSAQLPGPTPLPAPLEGGPTAPAAAYRPAAPPFSGFDQGAAAPAPSSQTHPSSRGGGGGREFGGFHVLDPAPGPPHGTPIAAQHRIWSFGVDTHPPPPHTATRPAFVASTPQPSGSHHVNVPAGHAGTAAAAAGFTARDRPAAQLRSVGPAEFDGVPKFLANQVSLEEVNGAVGRLNALVGARRLGGLSLEDAEMLGMGAKAKVLLTILMRLDRITPSTTAATKNYYLII